MKDKAVRIKCVPIEQLLESLLDAYNMGAEFIDVVGVINKHQEGDICNLVVQEKYVSKEPRKTFLDIIEYTEEDEEKLNDNNLNDLI